jgi:hypothetical protein
VLPAIHLYLFRLLLLQAAATTISSVNANGSSYPLVVNPVGDTNTYATRDSERDTSVKLVAGSEASGR